MKKIFTIFIILIAASSAFSQLGAYLYMAQFDALNQGPYMECYLGVNGETLKYKKNEDGLLNAKLQILYLFKQDGAIKAFEKYELASPVWTDTTQMPANFTDVQRVAVPNGVYNFELIIKDLNDSTNAFKYTNILTVDMSGNQAISDIELVESYEQNNDISVINKNGYKILPYISNFYPQSKSKLNFYAEVYQKQNEKDVFLLQYFIRRAGEKNALPEYSRFKKTEAQSVSPILAGFDISELTTGNYELVLQLRDKTNQLKKEKVLFIQRINEKEVELTDTIEIPEGGMLALQMVKDANTMKDMVLSLYPILNQRELYQASNAVKSDDLEIMKAFFQKYWYSNSNEPETDWNIYKTNVDRVNASYSTQIKRGYETDRGRVFLKYGQPNDIIRSNHEPSTYPYEIWQYFALNNETNVKFVFYSTELVGEDYQLLHSTLNGEVNNPYWQRDLTKRNNTTPFNFNDTNGESQYGNRANDMYNR
ncbi:MAG: GWxTD domain-containing protein [Bacteroidales bacterium]|nr:GWxTD domain-containing protein [Bacteroidales bacterium]